MKSAGYGVTNIVDAADEDFDRAQRERRRRRAAKKRRQKAEKKAHHYDPSCATCRAQRARETWPKKLLVSRTLDSLVFRAESAKGLEWLEPRASERVYVLVEVPKKKGRKR